MRDEKKGGRAVLGPGLAAGRRLRRSGGGAAVLLLLGGGGYPPGTGDLRLGDDPLPLSVPHPLGFCGPHPGGPDAGTPFGRDRPVGLPLSPGAGTRHPYELDRRLPRRGQGVGGNGGARGHLIQGRGRRPHLLRQQRTRLSGGGGGGGGVPLPRVGVLSLRLPAGGGSGHREAPLPPYTAGPQWRGGELPDSGGGLRPGSDLRHGWDALHLRLCAGLFRPLPGTGRGGAAGPLGGMAQRRHRWAAHPPGSGLPLQRLFGDRRRLRPCPRAAAGAGGAGIALSSLLFLLLGYLPVGGLLRGPPGGQRSTYPRPGAPRGRYRFAGLSGALGEVCRSPRHAHRPAGTGSGQRGAAGSALPDGDVRHAGRGGGRGVGKKKAAALEGIVQTVYNERKPKYT